MNFLYSLKRLIRKIFFGKVFLSKHSVTVNCTFSEYVHAAAGSYLISSSIGRYTSIGRNTSVIHAAIGNFCSISWNVTIGATAHPMDRLTTHAFPYVKSFDLSHEENKITTKTTVGHDVWIGTNVVILPGVRIGNGAVIGAGAVVTSDVPDYAVCAGVPAKILRYRFDEQTILKLHKVAWWNWDANQIKKNISLFTHTLHPSDIDALLKE